MDTEEAILYCEKNKIEGAYVECGVFKGKHPKLACDTILENNLNFRNIYMFDTFEGMPKPSENDFTINRPSFNNKKKTLEYWNEMKNSGINKWCYCSLEEVKQNIESSGYPKEKLHYVKGDVMKTLLDKNNIPNKIAILRLDTDWYDSSKFELEQLYSNVVDGGVVILDDYFFWNGQKKATDEYFEENNIHKKIYNGVKHNIGYFIK